MQSKSTKINSPNLKTLGEICIKRLNDYNERGELYLAYSKYWNRLMYELRIIGELGYENIFLITMQFIAYARSEGVVVGPGRGSAAGSLVCHCTGITRGLDPLRFGLRFERFLNPSRVTSADIDVDFSDREVPIRYLVEKYGANRVIQVGTKGLFKIKSALDEFARVFDISFADAKRITACFDDKGNAIKDEAANWEKQYPELFETARVFADSKRFRNSSKHPSAVIVTSEPIGKLIPLQSVKDSKTGQRVLTTEWDGDELESIGFTKFDILRVSVLNVIADTVEMVNGSNPDSLPDAHAIFEWVPLDDPKTIALADRADLVGVFQLWKSDPIGIFQAITVKGFEDFYLITTVIRPGIDRSDFIKRHENPGRVNYVTPQLEPILSETYGMMLYQEQIMDVVHKLAGFTLAESDNIRKIIAKTSNMGDTLSLDPYKIKFIDGCVANGVSGRSAEEIWSQILAMQSYSFNKSHAVSYSLISWVTAYLKAHYPLEFLCASLNDKNEARFIDELKKYNLEVLPPDVQVSSSTHKIEDGALRIGLSCIKGVGKSGLKVQELQPFADYNDFISRCKLASDVMDVLERLGALDSLQRYDLLGSSEDGDRDTTKRLNSERQLLGYYVSGDPLQNYEAELQGCVTNSNVGRKKIMLGGVVTKLKTHNARNGQMAFLAVQTTGDEFEVAIWPEDWKKVKGIVKEDKIIKAVGEKTERGNYSIGQIQVLSK